MSATIPAPAPGHPADCSCEDCCAREFEAYRDPDSGGCSHFRDPKACDECAAEESHARYIAHLVQSLDGSIASALQSAAKALASLAELRGPAYDAELADGWDGADALDDLKLAAKLLRGVQRVVRERQRLLKAEGNR